MESVKNRNVHAPDNDVIDLMKLANAILRRLWLVVAVALLFASGAYLATKFLVTPTYRASFTAYINNRSDAFTSSSENWGNYYVTSSDVYAARELATTYSTILVSQPVLEEAAEASGYDDLTYKELAAAVTTGTVDETEIIQVDVTMDDPEKAKDVAQAIAEVAPAFMEKIVEGSSMQIVAPAQLPTSIYSPNYIRNTEMGFLLGGVLVAGLIVLKELLNNRVGSVNELEDRYGIAVMGMIPDLVEVKKQHSSAYGYGKSR